MPMALAAFLAVMSLLTSGAVGQVSPQLLSCPESGILTLESGTYWANSSNLGNCTLVGKPGAQIQGHVVFDHGEINGCLHFEGSGKASTCVSGTVKIKGDNVSFNGCDMGFPTPHEFHIHGGNVSFTHGGQICGLNIHSGNVRIANTTGCQRIQSPGIYAGPGDFFLDMANVTHYGMVDIRGGALRLEGSIDTEYAVHIKDSIVHFVNWRPTTHYSSAGLDLENVTATGDLHFQAVDHSYHALSGRFTDFNLSVMMQRGGGRIENLMWSGGSYDVRWGGPIGGLGVEISGSQIEAVAITGKLWGPLDISHSTIRGGSMRLETLSEGYQYQPAGLTLTNSTVELLGPTEVVVAGPIRVASSTLSVNGVASGALRSEGSLEVSGSSLAFANVKGGPAVRVQADVSMFNSNLTTMNCSEGWLSQATVLLV